MITITTPVACFQLIKTAVLSIANQVAMGQRYAIGNPIWRVEVYNDAGVLAFGAGPVDIVPLVWSHTPFPWGIHPEIIQGHFEDRAASVLGAHESTPCFRKCDPTGGGVYTDNRYYSEGIRMAWMMYVDLAIEYYSTKV